MVQNTCQGLYSKLWFRFTGTREVDEVSHSALDFAMEMDDIGEILNRLKTKDILDLLLQ